MCGASSSEVGIQDADEVRRQRATLINENPTETLSLQKEFVHVACAGLAVDFVSGIAAVHRDGSPGVNRETSDESCHCVLSCQIHKMHAHLPAKAGLEEGPYQTQACAFAGSWNSQ